MKKVTYRDFRIFTLIMVISWVMLGITVYGGNDMILINDTGSTPGSWEHVINKLASTDYLKNGPPSGNPGNFYYFKHAGDGTREMSKATISRQVTLDADQKTLCSLGQLRVRFSLDYFGWDDDEDEFYVIIYTYNAAGKSTKIFDSPSYVGDKTWRRLNMPDKALPADTVRIMVVISAFRESNSDLDVYLDNIKLWVVDNNAPVMIEASITDIKDSDRRSIPLKTDAEGNYLDNWVNQRDTIYGKIDFNEPVKIPFPRQNLNTPLQDERGFKIYAVIESSEWSFSASHQFNIALEPGSQIIGDDNRIRFIDSTYSDYESVGPFNFAVEDLGGNRGPSDIMKPNIDHYNIKYDDVIPIIITPWNSYEEYLPGRSSVQITVVEEDMGKEQSPLTMTYYWEYMDTARKKVTEERVMALNGTTALKESDGNRTTYTVTLDIPNGSKIPHNQVFLLSAEVNDEARNMGGNRSFYGKVNQRDITPPNITWDKSIHEDGTEVDISASEDTLYSNKRTVSFMVEDLESGVAEVKYLWSRETYDYNSSSFKKALLPGTDGKYTIETSKDDTPLEGMYYLNILAVNGSEEYVIKRKGFYFDCEAPRINAYELRYIDGKPASAHFEVKDRALRNKFLYALLTTVDDEALIFEPIDDPDISEGIRDNGMWKAVDLEGTGESRAANITGVLDQITTSGYYKLIIRYYDEYWNCRVDEEKIWYDFEPPFFELVEPPISEAYQKNHTVDIRVFDELSGVRLDKEEHSATWINVDTGETVPVDFDIYYLQTTGMIVKGNEDFNGRYNLKVKIMDYADNYREEVLFRDGRPVEYWFDNSPPEVNLTYNTEEKTQTVTFDYSDLKDEHSGISWFGYGISEIPGVDPEEWIFVDPASSFGNVVYPEPIPDGKWYLSVLLEDILGNRKIIHCPEAYDIDSTKPEGRISFERSFTNVLEVPLMLTIDELEGIENKTFKVKLSNDIAMSDGIWKDIIFEKGKAYYNWMLTDTADGEQSVYARFMDDVGNISEIYSDSIALDRTVPTGSITYDHALVSPTKDNITATLITDAENTVLNNKNSNTYIFNRNGAFEFIISDQAGNRATVKAEVNNIDKDPPKASVTYSHPGDRWTNESITAQLQLEDANGFVILSGGGDTHTFAENGEFEFRFKDSLGNEGSIKAEVRNIDKVAPVGTIISAGSDTAPVTVYLSVNEPVKVTNNNGSFRYVFEENGSFTFEFEDKAGNVGTAIAEVSTVTSAEKYVDVVYSDSGRLTNNDIDVEVRTFSGLSIITEPTVTEEVYGYAYRFTENEDVDVALRVLSGAGKDEIRTVKASVYNIDKTAPDAEVMLSTTELTNQNVTAALLTYDDRGKTVEITNNNGSNTLEFEENGEFTFELMDEAGNIGYKTVTVSNIDKTAPRGTVEYIKDTDKKIITARVTFPEETVEIIILNNNGSDTFEFVENGVFKFEYSDAAGNMGEATAEVTGFSSTAGEAEIEYYIDGSRVEAPNTVPINKSLTAKLITEYEGGSYTVNNNNGMDSYTFEGNGEFIFAYEDEMGNRGFAKAEASTIDKSAPKLQILADTVKHTKGNVTVTITYSDDKGIADVIHNLEAENLTVSEGKLVYTCTENKNIVVTVIDIAGNETTKEFKVDYIDRTAPVGSIEYTPDSITNQDVRAVLSLNEPGKVLNNNGKQEYIFIENGEFTFEFEDRAGNKGTATAIVNWIDKIPPNASLEYSSTVMSNMPVTVALKTDSDAIIMNNGGMASRTFYTNGFFTFRISDEAGNIVNLKAEVWNIDEEKPQIALKGYPYTVLMRDEPYVEEGYKATDNIDGDITDKVVVEGSVNSEIAGSYEIKYRVADAVGNVTEEIRTVRVIDTDELVIVINGKVTDAPMSVLDTRNVIIDALGNQGDCLIKFGEGKRPLSWFKGNGNTLRAGSVTWLEAGRWYTIFAQDRERKTKSISIYVNE